MLRIRSGGRRVDVAARLRPGASGDLLLCLHGLGCAKESFDSAFLSPALAHLTICTFDFPGHGGSGRLTADGYSIEAYADITASVIAQLAPERLFLLCHSMGCAVGLVAAQGLGAPRGQGTGAGRGTGATRGQGTGAGRGTGATRGQGTGGQGGAVDLFVSLEGNLVAEDCGMVSRATAAQPRRELFTQWSRFRAELAASPRADLRTWARWYGQADPVAVHAISRSLVDWSDSGKLLAMFRSLPTTAYIYGSDSDDLSYLLGALPEVPAHPIPGARHFAMLDNPTALWRTVAGAIPGTASARPEARPQRAATPR